MVGFNSKNLDSANPLNICSCCLLLLRDPVQLIDCGHRLCLSCANEQNGDIITCPACHDRTSRDKLIMDRGFKNDMQTLPIDCSLCEWTGMLKSYQNHLDQNHPNPICEYCGKQFTSVNDLDRHQKFICEEITIFCPLKPFGCEEMFYRIDLSKHYISERHQTILANVVRQLKTVSPNNTNSHLFQTTANINNQLENVNDMIDILSGGVHVLNDDIQRLKNESVDRQNELTPYTREFLTLKKSIEEQNTFIDDMKSHQEVLEKDLSLVKQKLYDMESTSYDGMLLWKITNMQERMADAQSEKQTSFYSPPFYSSPTGYKMCLRVYLYGDGNARRTHMSIFFVVMRGDFDPILKFPFCFKVAFCLYDQTSQQRHIIDSFRPDVKSNSFQRPRSDMNIASGIPNFVPVSLIQQENSPYIRDNAMFIKVLVDFGNIPKNILPYALSLSPGLTITMQQTMIQQEVESQRQSNSSTMNNELTTMDLQETDTFSNISTKQEK